MRVLVACEFSGRVRDAFIAAGHDAMSCDILPTDAPGLHRQGDVLDILGDGWDMMIAHPPCTYLAVSGARWWAGRVTEQQDAIEFVKALWAAPIARVAIENPIGLLGTVWRKPTQIVQPWMFGHGETKATCLWLRGLPRLVGQNVVAGRSAVVHHMSPSENRWKRRSLTYKGIADAMAYQWGGVDRMLDLPLFSADVADSKGSSRCAS